ncbi:hypothetical protein PVAG01_08559 [Phlyctema vagabunda]|uniref:Uncharacterized protein n=1 Tax=Phlyctema vagabunda TaxID=108571 RepID=A0ABR4P9V2_9HELO
MFKSKQPHSTWRPDQKYLGWQKTHNSGNRHFRRGPVLRMIVLCLVFGLVWYRFGSLESQSKALFAEHGHHRRKAGLQTKDHPAGIKRKEVLQHVVSTEQDESKILNPKQQSQFGSSVEQKIYPTMMNKEPGFTSGKPTKPVDLPTTSAEKVEQTVPPSPSTVLGELVKFPPYAELQAILDSAEDMPLVIHHTFEETTADVVLEGWEESWLAKGELDIANFGQFKEPKIDFVYTWVNGSDSSFRDTIFPYELNSTLNDAEGHWLEQHRVNRYRDWDELRYSIRTVEKQASRFRNKYMLLVNSVSDAPDTKNATVDDPATITGKQKPTWLKDDEATREAVQILAQEDFFEENEQGCLPTFNSLTIENQLYNTKSDTDRFFALSDDMLLGKEHAASDIWSTLFGPVMGFKSNSYNQMHPPTDVDARRFGEKPFLIYTSYLLNLRFGERKRKGQHHFGHSLGRSVYKEAMTSFPKPRLTSSCQRFRGQEGFQLYSWYTVFHYTMERHREALLWSYLIVRADKDGDGNLDWAERQVIMRDIEKGILNEGNGTFRKRQYYAYGDTLEEAGLEAPKVNIDIIWTSHDGPEHIKDADCLEFNLDDCLAPGFSFNITDLHHKSPLFIEKGFEPILPPADTKPKEREIVIKALWKYQYSITENEGFFSMVTDAEQVENVLYKRMMKKKDKVGQLCLNDDVPTEDPDEIAALRRVYTMLLGDFAPVPSPFEAWESPALLALQAEREASRPQSHRESQPQQNEKRNEKATEQKQQHKRKRSD